MIRANVDGFLPFIPATVRRRGVFPIYLFGVLPRIGFQQPAVRRRQGGVNRNARTAAHRSGQVRGGARNRPVVARNRTPPPVLVGGRLVDPITGGQ